MTKTIMFIGAGPFQLPGIKKAKEMGLQVVATDKDSNAQGLKIADFSYAADIKDVDTCLSIAKKHKIDGVLTVSTEMGVPTVAAISAELGLPGISPETAKKARNKELMRNAFLKAGVPSPEFRVVNSVDEAKKAVKEVGYPAIIKPTESAGNRGVIVIKCSSDIEESFSIAQKYSSDHRSIVEEFMVGTETTVEGFTYNNKDYVLAMSDKIKYNSQYRVATNLTYPPDFPVETLKRIEEVAKSAVRAIGIEMGPTHTEIIVTKEGPKLVEIAARGGGFKIFTDIVRLASGFDLLKGSINMAVGNEVHVEIAEPKFAKGAVLRFFTPPCGKVSKIEGISAAKAINGIFELEVFIKEGGIIPPLRSAGDRVGYLISYAENRKEALRVADKAEKTVKFQVEKSEVTDRFFKEDSNYPSEGKRFGDR
jgi:biotin carboxylase